MLPLFKWDLMDYETLKARVEDWTKNDEVVSQLDALIELAHAELNRKLRVREMENREGLPLRQGVDFYPLPVDYLEWVRFRIIDDSGTNKKTKVLTYLTAQALEDRYFIDERDFDDLEGLPEDFTIIGDSIQVRPTPNKDYAFIDQDPTTGGVQMVYYQKIPTLSNDVEENILSKHYPDILLYCVLMHTEPYLQNDERIGIWASKYEQLIREANKASKDSKRGTAGIDMELEAVAFKNRSCPISL